MDLAGHPSVHHGSGVTFLKIIRYRSAHTAKRAPEGRRPGIHVTAEMALGDLQKLTGHEGKLTPYCSGRKPLQSLTIAGGRAQIAMEGSSDQNPGGRQLLGRSKLVRRVI